MAKSTPSAGKRAPPKGSKKTAAVKPAAISKKKTTTKPAAAAVASTGLTHVSSITYKDLKVGTQVMAAVQDISAEALTLDLPFNKMGIVKGVSNMVDEGDISKHIKQAGVTLKSYKPQHRFRRGQLVTAAVVANDGSGREGSVQLSLLPSVLNAGLNPKSLRPHMWLPASVLTEEAHGYVLSFGIEGVTGFLKKSELPAQKDGVEAIKGDNPQLEVSVKDNDAPGPEQMKLGTLVYVRVLDKDPSKKTSLQCSAKAGNVEKEDRIGNSTSSAVKMNLLKVGTPVEAKVSHICIPTQPGAPKKKASKKSAGIQVEFMGPLKGVIHQYHLLHPILNKTETTMSTNLKVGQSLSARVLAVLADPSSHASAVYLTLLPNLIGWKSVQSQVEPGSTIEAARVIDVIPKDCTRFVGGGNLMVAHATRCSLPYRQPGAVGKKTDVRALGSNLLEMSIQVSAEEKVLAASVVNLQQVAVGMVFDKAVIEHFDNEKGLIVSLSDFVTGRVPKEQCTDQGNQRKLPKRYAEEKAEVRVRVLNVDPVRRQVTLTAKKSLVGRPDSDEEPPRALTRNADAAVGDILVGYVSKILDHGGCIVKFFGEAFGLLPIVSEGCAHEGALVRVRVVSKNDSPKGTRLRLQQVSGMEDAVMGEITKVGDVLDVEAVEGPAKCSGGRQGIKIRCVGGVDVMVPVMQLADDPDMAVAVMERVEKKQDLQDFPLPRVLVTAVLNDGTTEGTCKPVLVEDEKYKELLGISKEEIPAKIKVGEGLVGFVSNVTTFGAFVRVGGVSGLVPKPKLAEGFVEEVSEAVEVGQTVTTAVVASVDAERNMFKMDMQPRAVAGVAELGAREELRAKSKLLLEAWLGGEKLPKRGEVIEAKVGKKKPYGWMLELTKFGDAAGLLLKMGADDVETGSSLKVKVVDVDVVRSVVYACKLDEDAHTTRKRNRSEGGSEVEAKVMSTRAGYSTVLTGSGEVLLVASGTKSLGVEDTVKVRPSSEAGVGVLVHESPKAKKARRSAGEGGSFAADVSVVEDVEELVEGKELSMEVVGHTPTRVIVVAAPNIRATMHVAHCRPGVEGKLVKEYPVGSVVPVRVAGSSRVAAFSATGASQWNISVRDPKSDKEACKLYKWNASSLCAAPLVGCAVSAVNDDEMFITVDIPGVEMSSHTQLEAGKLGNMTKSQKAKFFRQHLGDHDTANSYCKVMVGKLRAVDLPKPVEEYKLGHVLSEEEVKAFEVVTKKKIELTAVEEVKEGSIVTTARVSSNKSAAIQRILELPGGHKGRIHATMACDDWRANPLAPLTPGMLAPAVRVISLGSGRTPTELCLKSISRAHVKALPKGAKDLKEGGKVSGYVASVSSSGLFVALSPWLTGRVLLGNVAEHPVTPEEAGKLYPVGTAVRDISITSVDVTKNQVGLAIVNKDKSQISEVEEGAVMYGQVSRKDKEGKGLFVRISGTGGRHGYCSAKDLFDGKGDAKALKAAVGSYKVGTKVRCRILSVKDDGKIDIGLAKKYFPEDDAVAEEVEEEEEDSDDEDVEMEEEIAETSDAPSPSVEESEEDEEEDDAVDDVSEEGEDEGEVGQFGFAEAEKFAEEEEDDEDDDAAEEEEEEAESGSPSAMPAHDAMEDSDVSEDEEEQKTGSGKKSARQKARERREREKETREVELANASGDWKRNPRGPDDFERLVLMSCSASSSTSDMPSASEVWIQYMGYWMQMAEVQRARECAERGIKQRLGFRDEQDRLNLWIAYLNLEAHICVEGGRKKEALKRVEDLFKRAASYNDAKKVHMAMCDVWSRAGADDLALEAYKRTAEKFGHSKKVWMKYLEFLYSTGKLSEARQNCLPRALRLTDRRKHSLIATRAAKLEYKYGTVERGKTIFESLLASQPKRLDIWSVYLDEHINANKEDSDAVRSVFDRAVTLKLKPAKMKFFFKRWVNFEQSYGDAEHLDLVKEKAREYVMALEKSRRADDIGEEED